MALLEVKQVADTHGPGNERLLCPLCDRRTDNGREMTTHLARYHNTNRRWKFAAPSGDGSEDEQDGETGEPEQPSE